MLGPEGVQAEIKKPGIRVQPGETLANISSTPYLGVCLSETLEWEANINIITSKAGMQIHIRPVARGDKNYVRAIVDQHVTSPAGD